MSGEGAKERTDRVLLTPWVKFLWESYRNMLELLKNNLVNLTVYADVAKKGLQVLPQLPAQDGVQEALRHCKLLCRETWAWERSLAMAMASCLLSFLASAPVAFSLLFLLPLTHNAQLRNHLAQAEKYQAQQHSLKLDVPEVIQGLVDIRFEQLESSITVDMWQEAFRAIEEIHKLLNMSGKVPKASECLPPPVAFVCLWK